MMAAAWSSGFEFWITSDLQSSAWARKIDWYLNFQIMKAGRHQPQPIASELQSIADLSETEIETIDHLKPESYPKLPLLIACENLLPTSTVISIPFAGQTDAWSKECLKIWQNLNRPRIRVFLPEGAESDTFRANWHQEFGHHLDLIASI